MRPCVDLWGNWGGNIPDVAGCRVHKEHSRGTTHHFKTQAHNDRWLFIDTRQSLRWSTVTLEHLTTSCLFNCAYSLENYRTLRLVIWRYSLPLIVVRFVVPDFWSHVIRRPHVCMSIGLWAAMQTQTNLLKYHHIENTVTHLLRIRFVSVLLCLFRIHAEPKSPSLIVASSVRKIFCFRTQKREEMS